LWYKNTEKLLKGDAVILGCCKCCSLTSVHTWKYVGLSYFSVLFLVFPLLGSRDLFPELLCETEVFIKYLSFFFLLSEYARDHFLND